MYNKHCMNLTFVKALLDKQHYGKVMYLMKNNIHVWSKDDYYTLYNMTLKNHYVVYKYFRECFTHVIKITTPLPLISQNIPYDHIKYNYQNTCRASKRIYSDIRVIELDTLKWFVNYFTIGGYSVNTYNMSLNSYTKKWHMDKLKYIMSDHLHSLAPNDSIYKCSCSHFTRASIIENERFRYMISDYILQRIPKMDPFIHACKTKSPKFYQLTTLCDILKYEINPSMELSHYKNTNIYAYLLIALHINDEFIHMFHNIDEKMYPDMIQCACKYNNMEILKFMTKSYNMSQTCIRPIDIYAKIAYENNNLEMIEYLFSNECALNKKSTRIHSYIINTVDEKIIKLTKKILKNYKKDQSICGTMYIRKN